MGMMSKWGEGGTGPKGRGGSGCQPAHRGGSRWSGVLYESKTTLMLNARECCYEKGYPVSPKLYVKSSPLKDVKAIQVATTLG